MSDIVDEMKNWRDELGYPPPGEMLDRAIAEITSLRAEVERLTDAEGAEVNPTDAEGAEVNPKKLVVVNLGDVRDGDWETKAVLGLELMGKMREAGFGPYTESPYVSDSMDENWYELGLGEDGDVPLLIVVEIEDNDKFKANFELLKSIVGETARCDVLGESDDEEDE